MGGFVIIATKNKAPPYGKDLIDIRKGQLGKIMGEYIALVGDIRKTWFLGPQNRTMPW